MPRGSRSSSAADRSADDVAKPKPRITLDPAEIARRSVARRPSPPGLPDKAEVTMRLVLPRTVLAELVTRALREGENVEALVQDILQDWVRRDGRSVRSPTR